MLALLVSLPRTHTASVYKCTVTSARLSFKGMVSLTTSITQDVEVHSTFTGECTREVAKPNGTTPRAFLPSWPPTVVKPAPTMVTISEGMGRGAIDTTDKKGTHVLVHIFVQTSKPFMFDLAAA